MVMNMKKEYNPEYTKSHRAYKKRIATRCRVCGGQLLVAEEIAKEIHEACDKDNSKMYMM